MITSILVYTLALIATIGISWFAGYKLLKLYGYQIVPINDENNEELTDEKKE